MVTLPNTGLVVSIVIGLFIAYRVNLIIYRLWFHPLSKFPGSKLWAATDLPYTYTGNISATAVYHVAKFHRQYGPVVRIGPDRLAIDGSIGWPQVYARRVKGQAEFPKAPRIFGPAFEASLVAAPHDRHRRQRRQLAHAFSQSAISEQQSLITGYVHLLLSRITERAERKEPVNVVQWLNFTTFDIISDLTYGESFGSLEGSEYHPWVLSLFKGLRGEAFKRACLNYPTVASLLIRLFGGSNVKQSAKNTLVIQKKTDARMALGPEPKGRRDFMTYMLRQNSDGQPGLSHVEIHANSAALVVAGSETTASALSAFFFYLGQAPRAKKLVLQDIREEFQDQSEIDVNFNTAKLEYLHAALEETLRVYPPAASTPPRECPGADIDGKYVPAGTIIHVMQWATFRNPRHFRDADAFCPERWLKPSHPLYDAKFENDNRAAFKPFSTGPRDCIGKNLAYAEMRLIVCHLLYKLDFELVPGQEDWHAKQRAYFVWDKGPLYVRFSLRSS
ncbi:hypothetical protein jhhlp_000486 [Lomentospora prolificans]|uniref:Uncharacterized protein n=1 Tax=Lomentospora prolificans TaxID=41688 RepID=A0A2N3NL33_9PEZI|nr:hypothetical protein jhhlp_000486 [Lomentospora prolificans]